MIIVKPILADQHAESPKEESHRCEEQTSVTAKMSCAPQIDKSGQEITMLHPQL